VATAALSPADIAAPIRRVLARYPNIDTVLAEVSGVDPVGRRVLLADGGHIPYDALILAVGSMYNYFGHEDWAVHAPGVKTIENARTIRARLLRAFEQAETENDPARRKALLTIAVIGGGPTGVEMAGQIGELARDTLRRDFRSFDSRAARILLVEATDRLLGAFRPSLSAKAARALERLGVTPALDTTVVGIDEQGVTLQAAGGAREHVQARTVIWAAGVRASGLARLLGEPAGAELDRAGRLVVEPDLTLPGHPEVVAAGDMVRVRGRNGELADAPGVAQVAIQQGRYAARLVADRLAGRPTPPFRYHDKGSVATIGRGSAVADLGFVRLSGAAGWLLWLGVHLWQLIGFQNRLLVLIQWSVSFVTHGRGARLITGRAQATE
jgi:NADH dehydrogenase